MPPGGGQPYPPRGRTPCDLGRDSDTIAAMTLDPVPLVAGGVEPSAAGDAGRAREAARRQWQDRRALERRLHDGPALRISALALRLGLLRHLVAGGDPEFRVAVEGLQDELHLVLQELRDVAGRIYPPLLDEAGLGPALREVAARTRVPVRVDAPDERFGPAAEGAAYFALLGCLVTADRGADGRPVDVVVRRDGTVLTMLVTGLDACHAASIHDDVRLLGGTVAVEGVGGAAPISVRIPCV